MSKIRVANAPCSWGVLEFDLEGKEAGYDQVLDEMVQSGYGGTELGDWGFMPTDPQQLATELQKRNLSMLAAFVPVALANEAAHAEGIERAVKTARLLAAVSDAPFIVLADDNGSDPIRTQYAGRIEKAHELSETQWQAFTQGANRLAQSVLEETGVKTVFHHHCAGYVETPDEVTRFLAMTNPLLVGLCFDTGHYAYGGGNPVAGFQQHADRIWHVHFKDMAPDVAQEARHQQWDYFQAVQHGVFCELGQGSVDFRGVLREMEQHRYSGWVVVEQDVLPGMGTPYESALRNRNYLKRLGL